MEESQPVMERPVLSLKQAAILAGGISVRTLWREITSDRVRTVGVRKRVLVDPRDLDAWIESRKTPAPDPPGAGGCVVLVS